MNELEIMRAEAEWQRAGAYSVRVQGMNRQHGISLKDEFDEHDCEGTRYIVILDGTYPVATCRFYELGKECVMLGRVVVLPEYRGKNIGRMTVGEAESWARELGYREVVIDSRVPTVGFYEKLGYEKVGESFEMNGVFECIRMKKKF